MVAKKGRRDSSDSSPVVEVGEIDTSAPFQSVKDAVNLFGEAAFSAEKERPAIRKPNPQSAEKVLVKQTELHLAQKELSKLKEQLKNAETIREQALSELDWAKRTVDELTRKLEAVNESRDSANKATEAAKSQIEENVSVSGSSDARIRDMEQYEAVCKELESAKQELRKIRQVSNEILETKTVALSKVEEAKEVTKVHSEKIESLKNEIAAVNESVEQTKLACSQARKEQCEIFAEKEVQQHSYKAGMEESAKKSLALKNEFDPEFAKKLEVQLTETYNEIDELQKQMETAKASDMDSVNGVSLELNEAKGLLEKLVEEEKSLQELVESLKAELKNVKMEHSEVEAKEAEIESVAGDLHMKLSRSKSELEECVKEESKANAALEDMMLTINQISTETETARREAEEMRNKADELMKEAESAHLALEESELHLRVALDEAEEAKAAETKALEQIKSISEKTNAARNSTSSESGSQSVTLSQEEFKSLSKRAEVCDKLAELKVAAALAQVEAVKASENETLKKLETTQEEIKKLKTATEEALKKAAMADAAKKAVEGELRRWRERDQKKAEEAATRILAEAEMKMATESSPQQHYKAPKQKPVHKKLEKTKTSVVSKKVLLPNLSGIFNRKKNQVEWGSPSYLPGEKPF
ncbi:PREDICTED: WEB family protein At5g55860-like isoform X1 [Camelina sativa]|uniref:WEB family protein At5g55860-like isoform X1 n=1 Tax=Camelina sativa TaxID=90675 RepID=A0ABM0V3I3_CAMSA|nr:PREDICTED: WEB family protein At5g55860-like isoform X1 [Camelina sativa]